MQLKISELFLRNPFHILELSAGATAQEIDRQGGKILGMLELGMEKGGIYQTPWGTERRDASDVRQAMAELRDPARCQFHLFWMGGDIIAGSFFSGKQKRKKADIDYLKATGFET